MDANTDTTCNGIDPESIDLASLSREQLCACVEVGKAITAELDPGKLIPTIMDRVSRLLPSETWSLFLIEEETQCLRFEISVDIDPVTVKDFRLTPGQGVAGQAALQQRLIVVEDVTQCDCFFDQVDRVTGCRTVSLICVPLLYAGRTLGVLEVVNPKRIDNAIGAMLNLLADYLAIAIENTRRYRLMEEHAVRDNLTGLFNQRYLYAHLRRHLADCRLAQSPLSLVFMDMDDFKHLVDRLGHLNGSRALAEVAHRIQRQLIPPAFGVAYGGDEFVIVLPECDRHQAVGLATQIHGVIKDEPYLHAWGHSEPLTASFGVATFPDDADTVTELLALADKAMFEVKTTGKDRVRPI
ncbi:MAG: sensor domain-containing diguanylate cyclase [Desulfatitalea sp.]|nr:sensor domain-containing diguanylate cyclase [Desulfatitalea sp.]NNJ99703.1 sensor domain-containing diguanylate cyclase [Desulfatitalea sp.]